jgi:pyruvate formate lyase activating enzyme
VTLDIRGFLETSFLDWDGKVVATIFLPNCNFRCPFCHNVDLLKTPENLERIPVKKIEQYLIDHKDFIDGICITGGEPCMHQRRGLFEFMRAINKLRFGIKLDTNGADPECVKKAITENLVQYIAMDIKGPIDERYDRLSGVKTDISKIKQSIKLIMDSGIEYEFRTTLVPSLLNKNDVVDIARHLKGARKFVLQQFVPKNTLDPALIKIKPYEKEELLEMVEAAQQFVPNTILRGI